MKFIFSGDPNGNNPPVTVYTSRSNPLRKYQFALNGPPIEVHEDDAEALKANSHFTVSATKKKTKRKAKKKV